MQATKKFVKNRYGVAVCKCCASCKNKKMDGGNRLCMNGYGLVSPSWCCDGWVMAEHLNHVGKANGSVKRYEYLHFYLDTVDEDNMKELECSKKGLAFRRKTISEIREEFERKYGSIYSIE